MKPLSFQDIIFKLQTFWAHEGGCVVLQPYTTEMGAGTFHPATVLYTLTKTPWNVAYVQPSRRPADSRYGIHPNRVQHYYQFQVILKPVPSNIQDLYLKSLKEIGLDPTKNDIRFIEDNWESPTLGAYGVGWEIWCNGMEISQFTYMQKMGNIECKPIAGEITYGLERVALHVQQVDKIADIVWAYHGNSSATLYAELDGESEKQFSKFNLECADVLFLQQQFESYERQCESLLKHSLSIPAYEYCIKASHCFNLLDSRGVIEHNSRPAYVSRISGLAKACCEQWINQHENIST